MVRIGIESLHVLAVFASSNAFCEAELRATDLYSVLKIGVEDGAVSRELLEGRSVHYLGCNVQVRQGPETCAGIVR